MCGKHSHELMAAVQISMFSKANLRHVSRTLNNYSPSKTIIPPPIQELPFGEILNPKFRKIF